MVWDQTPQASQVLSVSLCNPLIDLSRLSFGPLPGDDFRGAGFSLRAEHLSYTWSSGYDVPYYIHIISSKLNKYSTVYTLWGVPHLMHSSVETCRPVCTSIPQILVLKSATDNKQTPSLVSTFEPHLSATLWSLWFLCWCCLSCWHLIKPTICNVF
jgi:hypothetical protein